MNGDGWRDPSTVRLVFELTNTATNSQVLRPISGPWSMFSRVRCMYQGAICDDISSYNRTHEMMSILTSKANRDNDDVSGFGRRWDNSLFYPDLYHQFMGGNSTVAPYQAEYGGIGPGTSQTVSFKPMIGVLNQSKYLPLMWGGFVMESEIIGDASEAFVDTVDGGHFFTHRHWKFVVYV